MNVRHSLRIALAALERSLAGIAAPSRGGRTDRELELAPGMVVQYCVNTDDRAWNASPNPRHRTVGMFWFDCERLKGAQLDVLWMAPLITGVGLLWVRLGLAASGVWPLF